MAGLVITPIWDSTVLASSQASQIEAAVLAEIKVLEATFSNSVTINLHVGWGETNGSSIGKNALASAGFDTYVTSSFGQVTAALAGRQAYLPASDPGASGQINLAPANAVALGLAPNTPVEASIGFSSAVNWDYSGGVNISAGSYDFADIAAHEITHVMGRYTVSGATPWLLDFFRYSSSGVLDLRHVDYDYFSGDGGRTVGQYFASSGDKADWDLASVSADSFGGGSLGTYEAVTPVDISVMQALGWNVGAPTDYSASIIGVYDTYMGRDPRSDELATWQGLLSNGQNLGNLRAAVVGSAEGQAHTASSIKALYDVYMGRDPSSSELGVWQGLTAQGDDFGQARSILLSSGEGSAHTTGQITSLYDTYFGRDPSGAELNTWRGLVAGGDDFNAVRASLVSAPEGQGHTAAEITSLYDTYFGRDPTASETSVWTGLVNNGADFGSLRDALVASPEGGGHTTAKTIALYELYFGRDPTSQEEGVWQGLVRGGDDFNQLRDTLERQSGAASVQHTSAGAGSQTIAFGGSSNLTVDSFDPAANVIALSSAQFGGINPLDSVHAIQISALDNTTDVLVTLDASHSLLLEHTALSALSPHDFIFV